MTEVKHRHEKQIRELEEIITSCREKEDRLLSEINAEKFSVQDLNIKLNKAND